MSVNERPKFKEYDEQYNPILPHEARLRNLTYQTTIYVDIIKRDIEVRTRSDGTVEEEIKAEERQEKAYIGKVPVMVRSPYCALHDVEETERKDLKECVYDQGGYFIINGGEKVIVA